MNSLRIIGLSILIVVLSWSRMAYAAATGLVQGIPVVESQGGKKIVTEQKNGLAEMREWLNQRNQERLQRGKGLTNGFNPLEHNPYALKPRFMDGKKQPPSRSLAGDASPPSQGSLEPPTGRGPDGRIHHRLIINEAGPDQLQVYTGAGYAVPYAPYSLKPKTWEHPKRH